MLKETDPTSAAIGSDSTSKLFPYEMVNNAKNRSPVLKDSESESDEQDDNFADYRLNNEVKHSIDHKEDRVDVKETVNPLKYSGAM